MNANTALATMMVKVLDDWREAAALWCELLPLPPFPLLPPPVTVVVPPVPLLFPIFPTGARLSAKHEGMVRSLSVRLSVNRPQKGSAPPRGIVQSSSKSSKNEK